MPRVEIRKVEAYRLPELREAAREFLAAGDPIRLKNAKTVLLKPNLLGGFPPERAVTTHPAVLEALIQVLLEMGKTVWLGDSPGGTGNLQEIWQVTGMQDLAERYPVRLVNLSSSGVQEIEADGVRLLLSKILWQADVTINVCKLKTHGLMAFTGAVKNLFGLVPGLAKTEYHKHYPNSRDFGHMLAVLHASVRHRVVYHLMDGIIGMDGAGPSAGQPRNFGLLFGSASAPSLDYVAARFMGFSLKQIEYVKEALHEEGIIPSQIEYPLSFRDHRLPKVDRRTAGLQSRVMSHVPPRARVVLRKIIDLYPYVTDKCQKCYVCVKSCPVQAIETGEDGFPVIGTDKCIRCLCCHEMCPHQAIGIHKSLLSRLFVR